MVDVGMRGLGVLLVTLDVLIIFSAMAPSITHKAFFFTLARIFEFRHNIYNQYNTHPLLFLLRARPGGSDHLAFLQTPSVSESCRGSQSWHTLAAIAPGT